MDTDSEFRKIISGFHDITADVKALDARLDERRKINAILTAWDMATTDPKFKAPSYLLAAVEAARRG